MLVFNDFVLLVVDGKFEEYFFNYVFLGVISFLSLVNGIVMEFFLVFGVF